MHACSPAAWGHCKLLEQALAAQHLLACLHKARGRESVASCRPAELVAKFMDNELRSGKDKKSDDQLEATLDKALMLFRYISVRHSSCCAPNAQDLLLCPAISISVCLHCNCD